MKFSSDNGLVLDGWQAIIWTNTDWIHWCIHAALGGDDLTQLGPSPKDLAPQRARGSIRVLSTKRLSLQRRPQAMLVVVGQKRSGKSWSPVCWRQLKMCVDLPRNIGGEKRPGSAMRLSKLRSRKSGDAGKPGRVVAARRNIRWPSASPNMLSIWQNSRLNKKPSRTLHLAALTFLPQQQNETWKPRCSRQEPCLQWH